MPKDHSQSLTDYLRDVHSIEEQSLQQLRSAPDVAGEPTLAATLRSHLAETEGHESSVRGLLNERGAEPSRVRDAVMRAGGEGFVLFARSQADTPGKLASHALAYEAMEWAAYDLLEKMAVQADEPEVEAVARSIRDEEREMMRRIESLFDQTVDASIRARGEDDLHAQLRTYLADAHAIAAQAIQLMESGRRMSEDEDAVLAALFDGQVTEAKRQQQVLERRLDALGGRRSLLKDAALRIGGLNWSMFFRAQPDTLAKFARFAYAFQHLEIGGYEQLWRVAERAGDGDTQAVATQILEEERRAAQRFAQSFDQAVRIGASV